MMTQWSPVPRYVLWDHRLGAQHTTKEQYLQADAEDQAEARGLAERLADVGLVAVVGKFSHDGPPVYGTVMTIEDHEGLLAQRALRGSRPVGGLSYGDIYGSPNYTEGQLSRVEALRQAMANGGIELPESPEPELAMA